MIKDPFGRRERKAERERKAFYDSLLNADRRTFLKLSGQAAAVALAGSAIPPHSFQLVEFLKAAEDSAEPQVSFRFAYVSDTHMFDKGMTHRFVKAALKAVQDVNALDPQPDFVLFGGDLGTARAARRT